MNTLAPVAFFGYNRPSHTRRTLEALMQSRLSDKTSLYIFIDGPKPNANSEAIENNKAVKNVVREKQWCKVFPGFLKYMNDALGVYANEGRVMHISGFSKPQFENVALKESTFFFNHTTCWGWATWKRAWSKFNPDPLLLMKLARQKGNLKKLNINGTFENYWSLHSIAHKKFQSWNTLWHTSVFLKSLTANFGFDGSGTNCDVSGQVGNNEFFAEDLTVYPIPLENNEEIIKHNTYKIHSFRFRAIFYLKHKLRFLFRR